MMQNPGNLNLSKFSEATNYEFFLGDDDFQDFEIEREINQFLDMTDLDETDDFFWDEN